MSKWVNNDKFKQFVNQKKEEKANEESKSTGGGFFLKWQNPKMGTQTDERTYKVRLLTDQNGDFYLKYLYHFIQTEDKTYYIKCEKTHGMNKFCPWCAVNQSLYKGNETDKKRAYKYKRNERFVGNVFIINDPRDAEIEDDSRKVNGTVRLYEFPATIEAKIKNELTNDDEGFGPAIFDPENGHDFIIKVLAKKPDKNNKVWPDYSLTGFSRKASAIADSSEKIEEIMKSVYDLTKYIDSMGISWEEHEKVLKQELVWDEVEDEFRRKVGQEKPRLDEKTPEENFKESVSENKKSQEETTTEASEVSVNSDDDINEDDLLNELESL